MFHLSCKFELSKYSHYYIFQPKIKCNFVCWPQPKDSTENKITLNDLYLIDIQNNTARFYNYSDPDAMKFESKIKPVSSLVGPEWTLFEAEMTQPMAEIFEQNGMKKDAESDETKIYISWNIEDGTVGWVPNTECKQK